MINRTRTTQLCLTTLFLLLRALPVLAAPKLTAREPDSQKVIKEQGFATHGLLIRNAKDEVVWKQADHKVKMDEVRAEIRKLLEP